MKSTENAKSIFNFVIIGRVFFEATWIILQPLFDSQIHVSALIFTHRASEIILNAEFCLKALSHISFGRDESLKH